MRTLEEPEVDVTANGTILMAEVILCHLEEYIGHPLVHQGIQVGIGLSNGGGKALQRMEYCPWGEGFGKVHACNIKSGR